MVPQNYQRDRFDAIARDKGRVGAHRAENPKARGLTIFLWAMLATVVLFAAGVFVTLLAMDKISFGDKPTAGSSAAATVAARVDTSFNVLILNATTDPSHTEAVKQALIAQGWAADKISDTTSDQTNFEHTTVYYVLPGDKGPALGLAQIFGHKTVEQSTVYQLGNADESPQLTIVIGADFGSGS